VRDYCLTSHEQWFSYITTKTSYMRWAWWCPLCIRPTHLSWIFIVLVHRGSIFRSTGTPYSDSESIILCCWEATNTNFIILVWPYRGASSRSTTLEGSTLTITHMRFH